MPIPGSQRTYYRRSVRRRMRRRQRGEPVSRALRVVLDRINIERGDNVSSSSRSTSLSSTASSRRSRSTSMLSNEPGSQGGVFRLDINPQQRDRELRVVLDRIGVDGQVGLGMVVGQAVPAPVPGPVLGPVPGPVPVPVPAPVPVLRPRRVARQPARKRTYKHGVTISVQDLEQVCESPLYCGTFTDICRYCGAKFFIKEFRNRYGQRRSCCRNGDIVLPRLQCPADIKRLFTENTPEHRTFLEQIRVVNSLFAMASFKTLAPAAEVEGQGRWCFSITGQIYHYAQGIPNTQDLERPCLNHYYFVDVDSCIARRNEFIDNRVDPDLIANLERSLRRHNRYIRAYMTMGEVLRERREDGEDVDNIIIGFRGAADINIHNREHRLPQSTNNIAAIYTHGEPPFDIDLKLYPRTRDAHGEVDIEVRHELKNLNRMCDPMVYPLLFPCGEDGYIIQHSYGRGRTSMREFYRYRIQCTDRFSILHNGGKLFQQYLVDAWVRVEANDLWYHRCNQQNYRLAAEEAIRRVVVEHPEAAGRVGRPIILPSSFQRGPRGVQRRYLDTMTVIARHGKPDLFITFTCDPKWKEIIENKEPMQKPEHRPDLVCRVFQMKLLEFIDDLVNKQIYGRVLNYHYVIEFQKRGLPHAHIVVTFVEGDKIITADDVDGIVSAVIPDKQTQPRLYALVAKHQIHKPCGVYAPAASCMVNGRCKNQYPKDYTPDTVLNVGETTRPLYRRPRDNRFIKMGDRTITNTRVVPYNPYALAKYQTHINFEVVGSIRTLKYLNKYITKGVEYINVVQTVEGENVYNVDEISRYLECRYVSAMESTWQLLEFKMHDRSHAVLVLPVHLPGARQIVYDEEEDVAGVERRLNVPGKLEAWFLLNSRDANAREFYYSEIPEHYVWDDRRGRWNARVQVAKMLGCMVEVSPRDGNMDLFYLRILLRHVNGATSYEYLRTVNGVVHDTFQAACEARNLLEHDDEYERCLREAVAFRFPRQLRKLFATVISVLPDERLGQVVELWNLFKDDFIEDFTARGIRRRRALQMCVDEIQEILNRVKPGTLCAALGIVAEDEVDNVEDVVGEGGEVMIEDVPRRLDFYDPTTLNNAQKKIFLRVIKAVGKCSDRPLPVDFYDMFSDDANFSVDDIMDRRDDDDNVFYVDGPGGSGKTYLYNVILHYVNHVLGMSTAAVAFTGIAANLLYGGKTSHRCFRLPLTLSVDSRAGFDYEARESDFFRTIGLIVWDEAPMTHKFAVEAVDRYLREITGKPQTMMGGRCVLFGGDFRQVLPVVTRGGRGPIIEASLKCSILWNDFCKLSLVGNMRTAADGGDAERYAELRDMTYSEWLLALGEGRLPYVTFQANRLLPDDLIEVPQMFRVASVEQLFDFVFGGDYVGEGVGDVAVLCPTNAMVDSVNEEVLRRLGGDVREYVSIDELKREPDDELRVPVDFLNSVNSSSLPPHRLKLKVGAVVMLMRNLDVDMGQCNGTRMRVTMLGEHVIECVLLSGECRGERMWLPRVKMVATVPILPREIIRFQFPVRLAYGMTINKAQGQTLSKVGLYLKTPCFGHGQLYVAFSRVARPENVRVYIEDGPSQGSLRYRRGKSFTRNVVYHSLLGREGIAVERVRRDIIPAEDIAIAEQADNEELFGGDRDDEFFDNIDVEEILGYEPVRDDAPRVVIDEDGQIVEFVPQRDNDESNEILLPSRAEV